MKIPSLGEQEMELHSYIAEHSPISVREVATHFEQKRGLARTTVLTVMERLRKKGLLARTKQDGIFQYSTKIEAGEIVQGRLSRFVEKTLGGSVSPLIQYFLQSSDLTEAEAAHLQALAAKLESKKLGDAK